MLEGMSAPHCYRVRFIGQLEVKNLEKRRCCVRIFRSWDFIGGMDDILHYAKP